jgi:hypothetical protein
LASWCLLDAWGADLFIYANVEVDDQ